MSWYICFFISLSILCVSVFSAGVLSKSKRNKRLIITPLNVFITGLFFAAVVMFIPMYAQIFSEENNRLIRTLVLSIFNAISLFVMNGEFDNVLPYFQQMSGWIYTAYTVLAAVLFLAAPILTFSVVLSFFKNLSAHRKYISKYFTDVYVFSGINENSVALAKDLKKNNPKRTIVFAYNPDAKTNNNEELLDLLKDINPIIFKKDIANINFMKHSKKKKIYFFIFDEDASINSRQSLAIIEKYKNRENTYLYSLSNGIETELLFNQVDNGKMIIRRINEEQSFVYRLLYDDGIKLFKNAVEQPNGQKKISAVIVGLDKIGIELTKALPWVAQIEGYTIELNVFDKDPLAKSKIKAMCPELLDPKYNNGVFVDGDACYKINVHSEIEVNTLEFRKIISDIDDITYAFISLGKDDENLATAINIRTLLAQQNKNPLIDVIVVDPTIKKNIKTVTNYKKQDYEINLIGDKESSYCEKVILHSELEQLAYNRHKSYCAYIKDETERKIAEENFWKYEYNCKSSIASIIHKKIKEECNVPGVLKPVEERTQEELWSIRKMEHRRWNAYMRAEGYIYGETRNDIAKTHPCLTLFEKLSKKDQEKDDD